MDNLFCKTVKKLKSKNIPDTFKYIDKLDLNLIMELENAITNSYKSDDEDIEDLGDIIQIINISTENAIMNDKISDFEICNLMKTIINGKKRIKEKYRDIKNKDRKCWNYEDAHEQFKDFMEYIWIPSIETIKVNINKYRKNMKVKNRPKHK